jgi:hypothetical protein
MPWRLSLDKYFLSAWGNYFFVFVFGCRYFSLELIKKQCYETFIKIRKHILNTNLNLRVYNSIVMEDKNSTREEVEKIMRYNVEIAY